MDCLLQAFTAKTKVFQCLECKLPQHLLILMICATYRSAYDEKASVTWFLLWNIACLPIGPRFWTKASFWEPEHTTNWQIPDNIYMYGQNLNLAPGVMLREATTTELFLVKELPNNKYVDDCKRELTWPFWGSWSEWRAVDQATPLQAACDRSPGFCDNYHPIIFWQNFLTIVTWISDNCQGSSKWLFNHILQNSMSSVGFVQAILSPSLIEKMLKECLI